MSYPDPFKSSEPKSRTASWFRWPLFKKKHNKDSYSLPSQEPLIPYPFRVASFFFIFLWIVFFISKLPIPVIQDLLHLGVIPRHPIGLLGIFIAPWIHANLTHLLSNQALLLHLVFLSLLKPSREGFIIFVLVVSTGLGVWLFGMDGNHVGASGLIFALQGFNLLTSFYQRRWVMLIILIFFLLIENSFLYGIFGWFSFDNSHISYSSHISGLLFGILWASLFRKKETM